MTTRLADDEEVGTFLQFLDKSWTAYHAVETGKGMLAACGFVELDEAGPWPPLKRGGRYFFTRNMSSLVAFAVGGRAEPGCGVAVVGAHTDSPCPKLKPKTALRKGGYLNVAVQPYGGGLWHTWFDRDLGVAGRLIVKQEGRAFHRLVRIGRPIMRIPTLAIHLDRTVNSEGFKVNVQQHLQPMLATVPATEEGIEKHASTATADKPKGTAEAGGEAKHHPLFLGLLSEAAGCKPGEIEDFELQLCDVQPAALGGAFDEFIFSGRLDNLASSYCALRALVRHTEELDECPGIVMVALFDHEEVGSVSAQGAGSALMGDSVRRVSMGVNVPEAEVPEPWALLDRSLRRSMVVSVDMAHGVHPNYADRHDGAHMPRLGGGMVIKHNANQRYASDAVSSFIFRECGTKEKCPTQDFVIRSDMACGSTIGPTVSANTGMRTVDVGISQLSMHSVREVCSARDIAKCINHLHAFYRHFWSIDEGFKVDATSIASMEAMPQLRDGVDCAHCAT